jgi:hypothetical protein
MKLVIRTPRVPNFISVDIAGSEAHYPLTAFDDEDLETICARWKSDLFANRDRQAKDPESFKRSAQKESNK